MPRCHARSAPRRSLARQLRLPLLALALLPIGAHALSGTPATPEPALDVLRKLSDAERLEAAFEEGVALYETGHPAAAVERWQALARRGHAGALFGLGAAHATGNGVPRSLERAIAYWEAAAARGHTAAQVNLGLLYWRGEGVARDLAQARRWWLEAAIHGDPTAQFHLGAMAATGEGTPRDYRAAVRWWRRAAAQGYRPAIEGLELLKRSGVRVD
ncbi:MAG TPA: tetratricopeptide repeat protein [Burkholderiales bacterium]